MKKLSLLIAISITAVMISCGESEESNQDTTLSDTISSENSIETDIVETNTSIIEDLENDAFSAKMNEVEGILIDVRTAEEYNRGHIEGALNLDYNSGAFEAYIDSLETDVPVFVYCQAGGRSGKARDILNDRNFAEVYNLKNGYGNWDK